MNKKWYFTGLTTLVLGLSMSNSLQAKESDSQRWKRLCGGGDQSISRISSEQPLPAYSQPEIKAAVKKLNTIDDLVEEGGSTFYLYGDIKGVYNLRSGKRLKPSREEAGYEINDLSHDFLTILCGEFRDNMDMFNAKLRFATETLVAKAGKQTYDPSKNLWQQITGQGYEDLISLTNDLYRKRLSVLGSSASSHKEVDQKSVPAITNCEYRFILKDYLSKGISSVGSFETYEKNKEAFMAGNECSEDEKTHYAEFRGDGNYKPHSIESNASIWNARVFARSCEYNNETKSYDPSRRSIMTASQCNEYFKRPFETRLGFRENSELKKRMGLAEQGLARLFFYHQDHNEIVKSYKRELIFITEDLNGDSVSDMVILNNEQGANMVDYTENGGALMTNYRESAADRDTYTGRYFKQLVHYVGLKTAVAQFSESGELEEAKLDELKEVLKRTDEALIELKEYMAKKKEETQRDLEKAREAGETTYKFEDKIEEIEYFIPEVDRVLSAVGFKGIEVVTKLHDDWSTDYLELKDFGFSKVYSKGEAWDRIANVLDRHTDWYQIDMLYLKYGFYQPTYSPWVASSYYIGKSDAFTKPGYAMGMAGDGHKHWMYVQKVKVSNWYKAQDMDANYVAIREAGEPAFDIRNTWFDETTFSRSHLGADEQGWDRFGTADPEEIGYNIWFYNAY